jgi:cell fate (sporulation/competence/biofilm development) regulator YmcA (YheA/YmcA/DUF963 family)
MEKFVKDNVLLKVDELVELIKQDEIYKRYMLVSSQMKNNNDIMSIISSIKKKQKDIVNLEYRNQDVSLLENEINNYLNELSNYPIYKEYTYLQKDLNDMFQGIKSILENYFFEVMKKGRGNP